MIIISITHGGVDSSKVPHALCAFFLSYSLVVLNNKKKMGNSYQTIPCAITGIIPKDQRATVLTSKAVPVKCVP